MSDVQTVEGPLGEVTSSAGSSPEQVEATVPESAEKPDSKESNDTSDDSTEEPKRENAIPHSRVKEMEEKAYIKGRDEAMKKLLAEQDAPSEYKDAEQQLETDDRTEAIKVLRDAIKAEVGPYISRQEVKDFLENNPDAVNYTDQIKQLRAANTKLGWEEAYKLASFDDKLKAAESKGVEYGERSVAAKEGARTEKPFATTPPSTKSLNDKLKDRNIPLVELEKELLNSLK